MNAQTDTSAPLVYSLDRAASMIDLSRRSLYRLIDAGELRTVKLGRRRLVPAAELARITRPAEVAA